MKFIKTFGVHIAAIIAVVVLCFAVVSYILNGYTRHGESLTVPDIKGLNINDAIHLLSQKNLRFIISDSMYFGDKPKLSVLEQNPNAGSKVKVGRCVYLIINSNKAPQVSLPNLKDVSLRQAESMLVRVGLKVGKLIYKPDIAKDVVLEVQFLNSAIQAGYKIGKGSEVDLVLGDGLNGESVDVPDLVGLTLQEAGNLIQSASLNVGSVVYLGSISDSTSAKVVRQNPAFTDGATTTGGQPIDLFLKQ
ncbi:MAG: PASTA domain-containing protein [Bacteroidia bacterium]|nr:PASTA domain-containing protein [Bacteroidia bacterium]